VQIASAVAMAAGFCAGWLWWSIWAPRWRMWALAAVADASSTEILERAERAGLLWSEGHFFERSEIQGRRYWARVHSNALAALLERTAPSEFWLCLARQLRSFASDWTGVTPSPASLGEAWAHVQELALFQRENVVDLLQAILAKRDAAEDPQSMSSK
jgi:hypothetical protein